MASGTGEIINVVFSIRNHMPLSEFGQQNAIGYALPRHFVTGVRRSHESFAS